MHMFSTIRLLSLLALTTTGLLAPAAAQAVQLADGRTLLAKVEQADGEGLRVRRLDNGGVLDLRWDHLSTASEMVWKRKFDLAGETEDVLLARAQEVQYLSNGTRQTVIGRIVDPGSDPMVVEARGIRYPIAKNNLVGVRTIEVPATQVYTKNQYYTLREGEIAPGNEANKHMLLAEDLIKFRDYANAELHLDRAKELGNTTAPDQLDKLIDRLKRFKAAAKELGMLEQIQAERSRGKLRNFEKGRELIATFEQQFPNSKLKAEFDREKQRFEQARDRYLTGRVAEQWRRAIQSVAEKKVLDDNFTLQAAKQYAENGMSDDIVTKLEKTLHLEGEEIREMWGNRAKYSIGKRPDYFNYGIGSWVLGDKAILKDTAAGDAQQKQQAGDAEPSGNSREIEQFAKLLRQAMERRRAASQGGADTKEQTDEGWWSDASRAEKVGWLRAYYAEFSGQMVVTYASASKCISCFGVGNTLAMGEDGKPMRVKCFLCQGTKWVRSFKAY